MSILTIQGKINKIFPVEGDKDKFQKQVFWLDYEENGFYQTVAFECWKNKLHLIQNCVPGEVVEVSFNVMGRVHEGRCFNTLRVWKIVSDATPQ